MAGDRAGRGRTIGTLLVVIGAAAWATSWFLPAASLDSSPQGPGVATSSDVIVSGPVYGFHAFLWAASLLPEAVVQCQFDSAVLGATCATNFVMLATLMLHRFVPWGRGLGFAALACALLNTTWLFLCEPGMVAAYRAGYWLWLASFGLVGFGIASNRRRP